MQRTLVMGFVALGLQLVVLAGSAFAQAPAQPGQAPNRPTVSPYLNLLRRGGSPAINYYGLVRPQFEFRRQIGQVQQDLLGQESQLRGLEEGALPGTGHSAGFMNYGHYYNFQSTSPGGVPQLRPSSGRSVSRGSSPSTSPRSLGGLGSLSTARPLR